MTNFNSSRRLMSLSSEMMYKIIVATALSFRISLGSSDAWIVFLIKS